MLLVLATPPFDCFFLAWIGLAPFFIALRKPVKSGFSEGFTAGFVYNAGLLYWLAMNSGTVFIVAAISMLVAALILAFFWGLAAYLFCLLLKRIGDCAWFAAPFIWAAWEGWLSFAGETSFPWTNLTLTQTNFNAILQVMEFTGVWGVSFWVVYINIIIFSFLFLSSKYNKINAILLLIWILIPVLSVINAQKYKRIEAETAEIMIVQGNIDPAEKWLKGVGYSFAKYDSLTRSGAETNVDLIVFPETAIPDIIETKSYCISRLTMLAERFKADIVTGATTRRRVDDEIRALNGAYLVKPHLGLADIYAKIWLVPFGERVPFQWLIPQLGRLNLGQAEFLPGQRQSLFETEANGAALKYPALICYESAFPQQSRTAVKNGANFLTTISNDAWYGRSTEAYQISALSRFRCIETRRAMARASNTGISFIADPLGRIIESAGLFKDSYKSAEIPVMTKMTFYVKYGNWFLFLCTLIYGIALIYALLSGKPD